MAQDEFDKKLENILVRAGLAAEDERLEAFEREMQTRRKKNLESSSQLILGELIAKLEEVPDKDLPIVFDSRYHPSGLSSWRGDYAELAIEYDGTDKMSLSDFLEMLKGAIGKQYDGYKGGVICNEV